MTSITIEDRDQRITVTKRDNGSKYVRVQHIRENTNSYLEEHEIRQILEAMDTLK